MRKRSKARLWWSGESEGDLRVAEDVGVDEVVEEEEEGDRLEEEGAKIFLYILFIFCIYYFCIDYNLHRRTWMVVSGWRRWRSRARSEAGLS